MKTSLPRLRRLQPDPLAIPDQDQAPAAAPMDGGLQAQWTGGPALATRTVSGVLWAALAAGPVALLLALSSSLGSPTTVNRPVAPVVDRSGEQAAVSEFAGRLVSLWLTSVRGQEAQLTPLLHHVQLSLPVLAWLAGPPLVADVHRLPDGTWMVITAIAVGPAGTQSTPAPATRAASGATVTGWQVRYFSIPVHLDPGGPVALALPAPVAAPGTATQPPDLGYRYQAVADDPIGISVEQFLQALLTGTGDVTRYLSPGTAISPVSPPPYTAIAVTNIATNRELTAGAAVPADGTHLRALVSATGTAGPQQDASVQYPLTLTVRGGRWEITAIDPAPAVQPSATAAPTTTGPPTAPSSSGTSPSTPATPSN